MSIFGHQFDTALDRWIIGDAERERQQGLDGDEEDFEPSDERQCDVCGAWLDDERLRVWNEKWDEEASATCANVECQEEYPE